MRLCGRVSISARNTLSSRSWSLESVNNFWKRQERFRKWGHQESKDIQEHEDILDIWIHVQKTGTPRKQKTSLIMWGQFGKVCTETFSHHGKQRHSEMWGRCLTRVRIYLKGDTSLEAVDICLKSEEEFPEWRHHGERTLRQEKTCWKVGQWDKLRKWGHLGNVNTRSETEDNFKSEDMFGLL